MIKLVTENIARSVIYILHINKKGDLIHDDTDALAKYSTLDKAVL